MIIMFGPMGPGGPPPEMGRGNHPKQPRPTTFKGWVDFILSNTSSLFKRLLYIYKLVWDARPWILLVMAFMAIFNGVSPVIQAYIGKLFIDELALAAMGEGLDFWNLGGLLVLQISYRFFVQLVNGISNMVDRLSNEVVVNSIRLKIMRKAKTLDLANFDLPEFYSKLENANQEVGRRPLQILSSSFSIVSTVISLVSFIVVLGAVQPWAPVLIILVSIPSAIVRFYYRRKMFGYVRRRSAERRKMDYFANLLVNKDLVKEVKLFHLGDFFIGRYSEVFKEYYKGLKGLIVGESVSGILLSLLNTVASGGVFLVIAKKVFDGILLIGDYTLYSEAVFSISNSVNNLITTTAGIYEGTLFIDNMITFMSEPVRIVPTLKEPRHVDKNRNHTIEFVNCSFAYPGTKKLVLENINLKIEQGQTVVLVGLNGAGKTTLLKLMTRLYDPTSGCVMFDGYDIREYVVEEIYAVFGIIFQDFGKYAFTVSENIGFGQLERVDDFEAVKSAAQKSSADEFIGRLKNGYDTHLTRYFEETGTELSIGQWQKLAVARAFFRECSIMILDEPTASLDPMAEQEIFNQFDELSKGSDGNHKTTIFVSHRLSSATIADKIVVLENGRIVEEGNHNDLIARDGKYALLFNTQAKRYLNPNGEPDGKDSETSHDSEPTHFNRRPDRPPFDPNRSEPPHFDGKHPPMPPHLDGKRPPEPPHKN